MNGELPKGWVWTSLGEIALKLRSGGTPLKKMNEYYENGTIPFVKIEDITSSHKFLYKAATYITKEGLDNSSSWIVPENSLLYSMYASYGMPIINKIEVATNQAIIAFIPPKGLIELDYIYYYLLSIRQSLKSKIRGTTQENLNAKIVSNIQIPLPPLAEQQRIVSKIEELFTNLDKGVESINSVKYKLKIYRQAILKYAMEGKLTEKWREKNKNKIESASILLEKIKEKSINKNLKLMPIDLSTLSEIPNNWEWVRLGTVMDMTSGKAFKKIEYSNGGLKLLQITNVSFGRIKWDNIEYLPFDYGLLNENLLLKAGDILMALNRPILNGELKIGMVKEKDLPSILYQRVGRFDLFYKEIKDYIYFYCHSPFFINKLKNSLQGVDQPFINKPRLLEITVPLPPLEEQNIIVERIEQLFSLADYIEETVNSKLEQSKTLRQSILKKAFEGKLVPQDPNDEPAEILLEKIKKQRLNKEKIVQEKLV
ncbi:MAG: Type-1 restriction enzyme MjaXIP specificity protein [Candidatus Methanofastidiosum methylothiophilum]|uniref:Type-1 restriction enzyme MjaXIP specificity protein n=1 Tax=Candidatus Methanofastidiosum methylothiophilum TaxID=1705564 RepID=A0A150J2U9_9EURY|nr:MAG: Type-1 restriction enzyme MjaXIP specificity protein [Candidatus Methanofastidiosum methylthiophilus]